jgi:large subunit ribosomal protein L23
MRPEEIIVRPLITEKATGLRDEKNIVAFQVNVKANKIEVKRAVERQFDVKVAEVRIARMHGKVRRQGKYVGRKPDWKKAYVRLAAGEKKIEFFEGV